MLEIRFNFPLHARYPPPLNSIAYQDALTAAAYEIVPFSGNWLEGHHLSFSIPSPRFYIRCAHDQNWSAIEYDVKAFEDALAVSWVMPIGDTRHLTVVARITFAWMSITILFLCTRMLAKEYFHPTIHMP